MKMWVAGLVLAAAMVSAATGESRGIEIRLTNRVMFTQRPDAPSDHETVTPYELTIPAGTTVNWYVESGKHAIAANDNSFNSGLLTAGMTWQHRFDTPGTYRFHDDFHLGGEQKALGGIIRVKG